MRQEPATKRDEESLTWTPGIPTTTTTRRVAIRTAKGGDAIAGATVTAAVVEISSKTVTSR